MNHNWRVCLYYKKEIDLEYKSGQMMKCSIWVLPVTPFEDDKVYNLIEK